MLPSSQRERRVSRLNRTGNNKTGWARRLTALLVTACLVMAMALPVYAEVDLLPDAPGEVELLEDGQETVSGENTAPPEQNAATPEPEQSAEPEQPAPTETPEPTAEPTPTPEPTATATATPVPTVTPTATPEPTEQPQKMYAAKSVDNVQAVSEQGGVPATYTLYFAVPDGWENYKKVKIYAVDGKSQNDHKYFLEMQEVSETKDHRKIYSVLLKHNDHYCHGGLNGLEFRGYKEETDDDRRPTQTIEISKVDVENNNYQWWRTFDSTDPNYIGGNYYDGKNGENGKWTDFVAYDPNNHLSFAGNKMVFENLSDSNLANVTAVFYEKDGDTLKKEVKTVKIGNVAAGKKQKFEIPNVECSYVQFFADDKQTQLSVVYNFYDQETENAFQYDASDKYCYTYTAENTGSWGTPQGGSAEVVYFDSTLSSYAYAGDDGSKKNSMPTTQDGGSGKMYCYFENDQGKYSDIIDMTEISPEAGSSRELWSATIPEGYTKVRFSGRKVTPSETGEKVAQKYDLTDMQEIPTDLNEPCFFADDGDDKTYWGKDVNRDGYWGEKNSVRDAEKGKSTDVVDIQEKVFTRNAKTKYVTSTLYDYYTDYELNGKNRDSYDQNSPTVSHRNWVPFRQFDQAISDYYQNYVDKNAGKSIIYPIYTGHFQPNDWEPKFEHIASTLNLYGWSSYKIFIAANNSNYDIGGNNEKSSYAFQGIVANERDSDGDIVMNGTTLKEPHFNEKFLTGQNSKNAKLGEVYHNVEFPFTQEEVFVEPEQNGQKKGEGIKYWWFDSSITSLYLRKDTKSDQLYLGNDSTGETNAKYKAEYKSDKSHNVDSANNSDPGKVSTEYGFFPFNENTTSKSAVNYNYGYGAKLEIPFTLTSTGTVKDKYENDIPIRFYFSGDDDVWVFIDNQLVLDIGGAHAKVSGMLEFDQQGDKKDTVTSYVSQVKNSKTGNYGAEECDKNNHTTEKKITYLDKPETFYKNASVHIDNLSTGKHTLTMYYMERGMWESNMAVAFNFPDNNELQVQKIVDTTNVNEWFKSCFDTPDLFAFNIKNQATHYKNPKQDATIDSDVNPIELNTSNYESYEPATKNNKGNIFELTTAPNAPNDERALHWYAKYQDTNPPSECRSERYGILTLNHAIDISKMRYLTFKIYAKSESGQGELSLGNLYLELLDKNGKQKGCLDKTCLNGTTYGTVTLENDKWITVKLDLYKLNAVEGFEPTQVKTIRVGDNYPRHIYFKDFVFSAQAKATTKTGFTTKQEDIPVYGSIDAGGLKNAAGAQFTTTKNNDTQVVDKNGQFMLQNGETVTFSDQFRRGSYISLKETLNPNLYDTTWTVFENDEAVQSYGSGNTVKGDTKNLNGQAATESQPGPDDGRTEVYNPTPDIANGGYTGDKKPDANTIVFRSYNDPDENTSSLTKLKVQFVNKVKTGNLVIKKAAASGENDFIKGKYTFNVTFTNVGDEGLEQETIKKQVTIDMNSSSQYEIKGIPIGTRFRIEEVTTSDGSHLQGVSVTGGGVDTQVVGNTYVQGSISGSGTNVTATATFTNTMHELINIDFTKTWVDANGNPLKDGLPDEIYIQLQRRKTESETWQPVKYPDANNSLKYVTVTPTSKGWDYPFANLDKFDVADQDHTNYQYRIVEGTVDDKGNFTAKDGTITIKGNTYVVKAEATANSETNSENGATTTPAKVNGGTITGGSGKIVLTNKLQNPKFVLDIIKQDANDEKKLLDGVEFKLEKLKAGTTGETQWVVDTTYKFSNNQNYLTGTTGTDGRITNNLFTNLEPGRYRLTETKAHPGYNLLSKSIDIEFTQDGKCYIDDSKNPETNKTFEPGANNTYTMHLTVLNRKTPELPHTGADAPSLWLLIGMPLAVAGLLIFTFRYNRKGGRRH